MCNLQQAVAALLARNPNHDGHAECDNRIMCEPLLRGYNNQNRPPTYDKDDNEDDESEEDVHEGYRGLVRKHACDNQEYCMKMELHSFNGDVTIEEFLDWWDRSQLIHICQRRAPVCSWRQMSRLMKEWFLQTDYQ